MQVTFDEIYHYYFHPKEGDDTPDLELDMYLQQQFPTILVPIHTELVQTFAKLTSELGQKVEPYRFDYPSLTRVLSTVNEVFVAFEEDYRNYVRGEMIWKQGILTYGQDKSEIAQTNSVAELQDKLTQYVVVRWFDEKFKDQVATLQDLVEVEEMVTASYLSKPDKDLLAMGSQEARQKFVNPEDLEKPSDNLHEAYKGLQFVLSGADLRKYLDRVEQISARES